MPIKELEGAKQRLAPLLSPAQRRALIEVMMGEVLQAVAGAKSLAGLLVVTLDPQATAVASRLGARVVTDGARDGHTGSVTAGLTLLAREGRGGMITCRPTFPPPPRRRSTGWWQRILRRRPSRSRRRTTISAPMP